MDDGSDYDFSDFDELQIDDIVEKIHVTNPLLFYSYQHELQNSDNADQTASRHLLTEDELEESRQATAEIVNDEKQYLQERNDDVGEEIFSVGYVEDHLPELKTNTADILRRADQLLLQLELHTKELMRQEERLQQTSGGTRNSGEKIKELSALDQKLDKLRRNFKKHENAFNDLDLKYQKYEDRKRAFLNAAQKAMTNSLEQAEDILAIREYLDRIRVEREDQGGVKTPDEIESEQRLAALRKQRDASRALQLHTSVHLPPLTQAELIILLQGDQSDIALEERRNTLNSVQSEVLDQLSELVKLGDLVVGHATALQTELNAKENERRKLDAATLKSLADTLETLKEQFKQLPDAKKEPSLWNAMMEQSTLLNGIPSSTPEVDSTTIEKIEKNVQGLSIVMQQLSSPKSLIQEAQLLPRLIAWEEGAVKQLKRLNDLTYLTGQPEAPNVAEYRKRLDTLRERIPLLLTRITTETGKQSEFETAVSLLEQQQIKDRRSLAELEMRALGNAVVQQGAKFDGLTGPYRDSEPIWQDINTQITELQQALTQMQAGGNSAQLDAWENRLPGETKRIQDRGNLLDALTSDLKRQQNLDRNLTAELNAVNDQLAQFNALVQDLQDSIAAMGPSLTTQQARLTNAIAQVRGVQNQNGPTRQTQRTQVINDLAPTLTAERNERQRRTEKLDELTLDTNIRRVQFALRKLDEEEKEKALQPTQTQQQNIDAPTPTPLPNSTLNPDETNITPAQEDDHIVKTSALPMQPAPTTENQEQRGKRTFLQTINKRVNQLKHLGKKSDNQTDEQDGTNKKKNRFQGWVKKNQFWRKDDRNDPSGGLGGNMVVNLVHDFSSNVNPFVDEYISKTLWRLVNQATAETEHGKPGAEMQKQDALPQLPAQGKTLYEELYSNTSPTPVLDARPDQHIRTGRLLAYDNSHIYLAANVPADDPLTPQLPDLPHGARPIVAIDRTRLNLRVKDLETKMQSNGDTNILVKERTEKQKVNHGKGEKKRSQSF